MTEIERLWAEVECHLPPTIPDADYALIKTCWHDGAMAMLDAASALTKKGSVDQALVALRCEEDYLSETILKLRAERGN